MVWLGLQAVSSHTTHHCAHPGKAPLRWPKQTGPVVGLLGSTHDHSESSARVEPEAAACPKVSETPPLLPCASIPSSLTALGGSTGQQPAQTDGYRSGPAPASVNLSAQPPLPCTPSPSVLTRTASSTSLPLPSSSALLSCHLPPHPNPPTYLFPPPAPGGAPGRVSLAPWSLPSPPVQAPPAAPDGKCLHGG